MGDDAPDLMWTSFETTFSSGELLFVMSTGDAWEDMMAAMHQNFVDESKDDSFDVALKWWLITIYFVSFQLCSQVILVNIFGESGCMDNAAICDQAHCYSKPRLTSFGPSLIRARV